MIHYKKYNKFLFYTHKIDKYEFVKYFNPEDYLLVKHNFARFWYYLSKDQRLKWIEISGCYTELYDDYNKLIRYVYEVSIEEFDKIFFDGLYDIYEHKIVINDEINKIYLFRQDIVMFWLSLKNEEKEKLIKLVFEHKYTFDEIEINDDDTNINHDININYYIVSGQEKIDNLEHGIEHINCSSKKLKRLDNLPESLINIICSCNKIKNLDNLPENIITLDCSENLIKNLDNIPKKINILNCSHNQIDSLDYLSECIIELNCSHNPIKSLDNLPKNLQKLICSDTSIISLDNLPDKLILLDISNNNIKELEKIPKSLKHLTISYSEIYKINIPLNLKSFKFENCEKMSFKNLPNSIEYIECSDISSIHYIPNNLKDVYCDDDDYTLIMPVGIKLDTDLKRKCKYVYQV